MFEHVEPFGGDPILSLNEDFQKDPRPHKINLSIGIYFDDQGRIPVLDSVRRAEEQVVARHAPKPYLPIEGAANFRSAVQALLFGADHEALASGRVATLQTVGSSGGLKVGADFIARWLPGSAVWVSDPSWENHRSMFEGAGLVVHSYPYYEAATGGLAFEAMCAALRALPAKSVVLLHACCHNPTGVDLTRAQWDALVPILAEGDLVPYLDLAYQGFGDGIVEDAYALRAMAAARGRGGKPLAFFVANSFSKSMSLYGERCGALSVVCASAAEAVNVLGQLKFTVRRNYSSPPIHGGQIVAAVLGEPEAAAHLGRRAGGDARAHQVDAPGAAWCARRQGAGPRLRLLPVPARHVQLHRPVAAAGRPLARGIRRLPRALGADVRRRPQSRQRRGDGAGDGRGARDLIWRFASPSGAFSGASSRRNVVARTEPGRSRRSRSDRRAPRARRETPGAVARSGCRARSSRR